MDVLHFQGAAACPVLVSVLACFALYFLYRWRSAEACRRTMQERYFKLAASANLYIFEYDSQKDCLELSKPCARLLGLPQQIENYSRAAERAKQEKEKTALGYVEAAMDTGSASLQMKIRRRDHSQGIFRAKNEYFYDSHKKQEAILGVFVDVTAEFEKEEALSRKARMDALTKVYNSGATREAIAKFILQIGEREHDALLIMDVDKFKQINDEHGHQAGDQTLQLLTKSVKFAVRETDFIGRLGGDEFCVYLHAVPSYRFVCNVCERINEAVEKTVTKEKIGTEATVSIGGTMVCKGDDFAAAYARADQALYEAKHEGRNTFAIQE